MIQYDMPQTGELEQELWRYRQRLSAGELFSLGVSHSFERGNTMGLAMEEGRISRAELAAGTYWEPGWEEGAPAPMGLGSEGRSMVPEEEKAAWYRGEIQEPTRTEKHPHAMPEDEWKKSAWYRERPDGTPAIEYTDHMTPQRAQILAEVYDRRRHEEQLISQSSDTFGRQAMLFGAGLLASLPDPINLIPFAGSLGKGASIGRKVLRGALEGAAGAAASDAVIFPVANARGEDFGFFDAAMDITFGGLIGGGLAGVGGTYSKWRDNRVRAKIDLEARDFATALEDAGLPKEDALKYARQTFDALKELPDGLSRAREMRSAIGGENRANAGRLLDRAVLALAVNESFDVGRWSKEMGLPGPPESPHTLKTAPLIEQGRPLWARDLSLAEMMAMGKAYYLEHYGPYQKDGKTALRSVETPRGEVFFRGVEGWKKYRWQLSPDKFRLLPFLDEIIKIARWGEPEPPNRTIHQQQGMRVHKLSALVDLDGKKLDVSLTVREAKNGKFFYDLAEIEVGKKNTPPDTSAPSDAGPRNSGGGSGAGGNVSRLSAASDGTHNADTGSSASNIGAAGESVNLQVRDVTPDMTPEPAAKPFRAPEVPANIKEELRAQGIDPVSGRSVDEVEVARLAQEGKVAPEEIAGLEAAKAEGERVNQREDIALSLIGCVVGGL